MHENIKAQTISASFYIYLRSLEGSIAKGSVAGIVVWAKLVAISEDNFSVVGK